MECAGLRTTKILTLDDIARRKAIGNFKELNIIVKGDVDLPASTTSPTWSVPFCTRTLAT